jgi:hypothetical protein
MAIASMVWIYGTVEEFAAQSRAAFKVASVLPNAAVYREANRLSTCDPRRDKPKEIQIELLGQNNYWSVYRVHDFTTLAVSTFDNETIDLDEYSEEEMHELYIPV